MTATAFLRQPAVLLAAVSMTIAFVWYALGRPAAMPVSPLAPGEKLDCVAYAPVAANPSLDDPSSAVSLQQITEDLRRLAPHVSCVRTYLTGRGLDRVPAIARQFGLSVLQGIALGRDAEPNRGEIERAIALAHAHGPAIRALVVGSEVLSRRELSAAELAEFIHRARAQTRLPVTYADRWETWLESAAFASLVDFITIHVRLYGAEIPVPASEAARRLLEVRAMLAERFAPKEILIGEVGWPSAGRMREAARPSPINQARVIHDVAAAAKTGNFPVSIFEGYDQPWRRSSDGAAGAHWGLLDADNGAVKFRWGEAVSDHPHWFVQGLIGILFALVIFAAGFFAARSLEPDVPGETNWIPVAAIALGGGLFIGWAIAEVPIESKSISDWYYATFFIIVMAATPPIAAAAAARRTPFEGIAGVLDPYLRRAVHPLGRAVALLLVLCLILAIQLALGLVFDPAHRDFPAAPLTGPAAALAVLASSNPPGSRRDNPAELFAAIILSGSALFVLVYETLSNWQAQWFAAVLLALAWASWRARGARSP